MSLRERGKQQRAARIVGAMRTLLRERPDEAPRTETIAAVAEVSPATVFNLVGTRDRLWAALADELLAEAQAKVDELPADLGPQDRARAIVTTIAEILAADAPVYRAVLAHWRESAGLMQRRPSSALADCLEAARAAGLIAADAEVERLARLVVTGCTGVAHEWAAEMISDRSLERRSREFVDLAFAAAR